MTDVIAKLRGEVDAAKRRYRMHLDSIDVIRRELTISQHECQEAHEEYILARNRLTAAEAEQCKEGCNPRMRLRSDV